MQGAILLKPLSAGSVRLRTNSPYDAPSIDPKYFEFFVWSKTCLTRYSSFLADRRDVDMLIRSMRLILHLVRTPPLSDALDLRNYETEPKDSDYYWIGDADPEKDGDSHGILDDVLT